MLKNKINQYQEVSKVGRYNKIVTVHIEDFFDNEALSHILVDDTLGGDKEEKYKHRVIAWLKTLTKEIACQTACVAILDPKGRLRGLLGEIIANCNYYDESSELIARYGKKWVGRGIVMRYIPLTRYSELSNKTPDQISETNCAEYRVAATLAGASSAITPIVMRQVNFFRDEVLNQLNLSKTDISNKRSKNFFNRIYDEMERVVTRYYDVRGDENIVKGCTLFDAYCQLLFNTRDEKVWIGLSIRRWRNIGAILGLGSEEISALKGRTVWQDLQTELKARISSRIRASSSSEANNQKIKVGFFAAPGAKDKASANVKFQDEIPSRIGSIN